MYSVVQCSSEQSSPVQCSVVQCSSVQCSIQVKVQWTEQLVAGQKQKTEQIEKETEKLTALADADRQKAVLQVQLDKQDQE